MTASNAPAVSTDFVNWMDENKLELALESAGVWKPIYFLLGVFQVIHMFAHINKKYTVSNRQSEREREWSLNFIEFNEFWDFWNLLPILYINKSG